MEITELKSQWALVTGASEGIGLEFCRQLAQAGLNLVLVARSQARLEEAANDIRRAYGVETLVLAKDLRTTCAAEELKNEVLAAGITIRLLINNAGVGRWGRFEDSTLESYKDITALNASAVVALCYVFMSDLLSHPSSAVVNVGSPAAFQPIPYMAVYAASKAFLHSFSLALHGEYLDKGILVQTLVPGPTSTDFDKKAGAYESELKTWQTTEQVVTTSLEHLNAGAPLAVSAKGTYVQRVFAAVFPPGFVLSKVGKMFKPT